VWPFRRARQGERDRGLGPRGEELAVRWLRRRGYKILARNYRCPSGEADVIALDAAGRGGAGPTIVFVEVKTRSSDAYVDPASAIDQRKRRQLTRVARHYLTDHDAGDSAVRFDAFSIVIPPSGKPRIRHIPEAFGSV